MGDRGDHNLGLGGIGSSGIPKSERSSKGEVIVDRYVETSVKRQIQQLVLSIEEYIDSANFVGSSKFGIMVSQFQQNLHIAEPPSKTDPNRRTDLTVQ